MLSIEITRECPLSCPGCYAYGDTHLGGGVTLSRTQRPSRRSNSSRAFCGWCASTSRLHVSLVGGEPMVRHRELDRILPALSQMGVFTLLVTSGVIPVPTHWMKLPRVRVAISVDGLPEHHDIRRKPATYERILKNIEGCEVNIHWVITRPMVERAGYLEEYVQFWNARPEVDRIWVSVYTPQIGEQKSAKLLLRRFASNWPGSYPPWPSSIASSCFMRALAGAFVRPPKNPDDCLFSKMSANYSADLESRVEPCVFGGTPGLFPVRLRHQHRPALGPHHQDRRPREGRPFHRGLA